MEKTELYTDLYRIQCSLQNINVLGNYTFCDLLMYPQIVSGCYTTLFKDLIDRGPGRRNLYKIVKHPAKEKLISLSSNVKLVSMKQLSHCKYNNMKKN